MILAGESRPRRLLVLSALVFALIAGGTAGWTGWSWWSAAHDDSLRYSHTRDEVLRTAEQAIQNLNTLDYRTAESGIDLWVESTTGALRDQLNQGRQNFLTQIQKAKTITTAKILDGAVTELDDRAGKASVIVAIELTVTPATGRPTTKRERLAGQLTRTGSTWKLSSIGQVPVSAA
jgi:Mce-associated membrane protein